MQIFVIPKEKFTDVVQNDPNLARTINNLISSIVEEDLTFNLDVTSIKRTVKTCDKQAQNGLWREQKAVRAQKVNNLFKNTVMQVILKNR